MAEQSVDAVDAQSKPVREALAQYRTTKISERFARTLLSGSFDAHLLFRS
jgi:hypothetical protein